MTTAAALADGLGGLGLMLPNEASGKLLAYVDLLMKWNRTYNLTAIREPERMVSHHLIDSLAVLPHLPEGSLAEPARLQAWIDQKIADRHAGVDVKSRNSSNPPP